ncbi:unnamed protein product [Rotaria sordida]|uniref:Uncharacterized protein n=1 Tax=Rotaria sordida TaxID=392033 RepID=A0A815GI76_9BILA|nr:unnamed protein product [Rotaria sordida]CAF1339175.1 unnamed protein product [Rotaria sordida]
MNMFDSKTKLLYYYASILLILSFLNQVNGRIIDTGVLRNVSANARWEQNGVTVAGGHGKGNANDQFEYPYSLFVDDDQMMIITDSGNDRIIQWKMNDTNGKVVAGGHGKGNRLNQLNRPTDVLIDAETDSLIICDKENRRVVQWSRRNGTTQGEILLDNISCYGLAMDNQRYLYISDYQKHEVRRYQIGNKNGTIVAGRKKRGAGVNQLYRPTHIFIDREKAVYVSDTFNHRVMKWNKGAKKGIVVAGGHRAGMALTQLWHPSGIFVDTLGTIYVVDSSNHRVMRWPKEAKQGTVLVGGNRGERAKELVNPNGLFFYGHGNIYVVDSGNHRVQRFSTEVALSNGNNMVSIASNYSSSLDMHSSTFTRKGGVGIFYFEAIHITPKRTGNYTFRSYSTIDGYGYLYMNPFDPSNVTSNLLTSADDDDESGTSDQFFISYTLQAGKSTILKSHRSPIFNMKIMFHRKNNSTV